MSVLIRVDLYSVNASLNGSCLIFHFFSGLAELKYCLWRLKIISEIEMRELPKVYFHNTTSVYCILIYVFDMILAGEISKFEEQNQNTPTHTYTHAYPYKHKNAETHPHTYSK